MSSVYPFDGVPVKALSISTRFQLAECLNQEQVIKTQKGFFRDYRGLAQLLNVDWNLTLINGRSFNPTKNLLQIYEEKSRGNAMVFELIKLIEEIGRFDVLDDMEPFFKADADNYFKMKNFKNLEKLDLSTSWSNGCSDSLIQPRQRCEETAPMFLYDAYVCYADEDLDFITSLVQSLEKHEIKLFFRERDMPLGSMEYDYFIWLIENQCRRVLIVLSPEFLECPECQFQAKFAASLAIGQRTRKLIPIVYKEVNNFLLPSEIRMLHKIDLLKNKHWFWEKLINSIKHTDTAQQNQYLPPICAAKMSLPLASTAVRQQSVASTSPSTPDKCVEQESNSFHSLPALPAVPTAPPFNSEISINSMERSVSVESNSPSQSIQQRLGQGKKWIQSKFNPIRQKFKAPST